MPRLGIPGPIADQATIDLLSSGRAPGPTVLTCFGKQSGAGAEFGWFSIFCSDVQGGHVCQQEQ